MARIDVHGRLTASSILNVDAPSGAVGCDAHQQHVAGIRVVTTTSADGLRSAAARCRDVTRSSGTDLNQIWVSSVFLSRIFSSIGAIFAVIRYDTNPFSYTAQVYCCSRFDQWTSQKCAHSLLSHLREAMTDSTFVQRRRAAPAASRARICTSNRTWCTSKCWATRKNVAHTFAWEDF